MKTRYNTSVFAFFLAALFALPFYANAQTVSPEGINLGSSSEVCTGSAVNQDVQITLPPGATSDKVDVLLLLDDTGSFSGEGPEVADDFETLIGDLETTLPGVEFGFGVARFEDYGGPGEDFGGGVSNSRPFILNQPIITAADAGSEADRNNLITEALDRTAPAGGGDSPESAIAEGLYQVATGNGFDGNGDGDTEDSGAAGSESSQITPGSSGDVPAFSSNTLPASGSSGGVGWRSDAQKIVILATDVCSISAFDSDEGIPATITGAGGSSEPVSAFACTSTTPGSSRFGFVGDAKSESASSITGAVVPSEAGTVQESISALNALGIQVVGLVPSGGPTSSTSPSFGPNTFTSAMARLTGAVDGDGNPLVFNIGADITAGLLDAIETTTTAEVDITLNATALPSGLSFDFSPSVVENVGPGGTAPFTATLTGDGSAISGSFDIQFVNEASGGVLGSLPANVACEVEEEFATVTFNDKEYEGATDAVTVASVFLPEGGFIAIHESEEGGGVGPVIGATGLLDPGTHENVEVTLFDAPGLTPPDPPELTESQTLIAMPHQNTNAAASYDFLTSGGEEDIPYFVENDPEQGPVIDPAEITIIDIITDSSPPECGEIEVVVEDGVGVAVETSAFDDDSGIRKVTFTRLFNLTGRLNGDGEYGQGDSEEFDPASTPTVTIRGDRQDFEENRAALITVVENGAGLTSTCDPVIETVAAEAPTQFALDANYPNPFNPTTTIPFKVAEQTRVTLTVYDVMGREVVTLVDQQMSAGSYEAKWDARDASGQSVSSGMYIYRIEAGRYSATKQMTLVK